MYVFPTFYTCMYVQAEILHVLIRGCGIVEDQGKRGLGI
jgi:hypothetical protein